MRWVWLLLLGAGLAGCAEAPAATEVQTDTLVKPEETEQPRYRFVLHARSIEDNPQDITFRIYINGGIRSFVSWPAEERSQEYAPIRAFVVPSGSIMYDIVIDGNVINGATMDIAECPNEVADAFVRVADHWQARSDYGCHVPGYTPSE